MWIRVVLLCFRSWMLLLFFFIVCMFFFWLLLFSSKPIRNRITIITTATTTTPNDIWYIINFNQVTSDRAPLHTENKMEWQSKCNIILYIYNNKYSTAYLLDTFDVHRTATATTKRKDESFLFFSSSKMNRI